MDKYLKNYLISACETVLEICEDLRSVDNKSIRVYGLGKITEIVEDIEGNLDKIKDNEDDEEEIEIKPKPKKILKGVLHITGEEK